SQTALGVYRLVPAQMSFFERVLYVSGVNLIFALLIFLLARVGNFMPASIRAGWTIGAWVGWSLFFVPMARRSGASLAVGALGIEDWVGYQSLLEIVFALIAVVLIALLAGRTQIRTAAAAIVACVTVGSAVQVSRSEAAPLTHTPDIMIILLDTMRGDHLGANGDWEGESLTPNLDALAAESVNFTTAFSGANGTKLALPTLFMSLPLQALRLPIPSEAVSFPELLQDAGYYTYGASANPLMSVSFNYDQGFNYLHDATQSPEFLLTMILRITARAFAASSYKFGLADSALYYEGTESLLRRAEGTLNEQFGPTFIYVQTMDVHGPYLPPKEYLPEDYNDADFYSYFDFIRSGHDEADYTEANVSNMAQRYAAEVRATDASLGRFFDKLKAMDRWDDTLIWIVSDHGDAFGEHGSKGHTATAYGNEVIRIPFIFKPPASMDVQARDVDTPVSLYDVYPTLVSLLGLEHDNTLMGRDLTPLITGSDDPQTVFSGNKNLQIAVKWPWKIRADLVARDDDSIEPGIVSKNYTFKAISLYNLADDPLELDNLVDEKPAVRAELIDEIATRQKFINSIRPGAYSEEFDPQMREKLRSLGYVE
ncbi:MAG: sulfatase, partial [Gammaproteobacteria bacterium]